MNETVKTLLRRVAKLDNSKRVRPVLFRNGRYYFRNEVISEGVIRAWRDKYSLIIVYVEEKEQTI